MAYIGLHGSHAATGLGLSKDFLEEDIECGGWQWGCTCRAIGAIVGR